MAKKKKKKKKKTSSGIRSTVLEYNTAADKEMLPSFHMPRHRGPVTVQDGKVSVVLDSRV